MTIRSFSYCRSALSAQLDRHTKSYRIWLSLLLLAIAMPAYSEQQIVGHVSFVKGNNAAQQPGAAPRILGENSEIFQGDNIQTTERSFVIVEFVDGSKVTVRPNSNFSIDRYDSQSANKSAQLVLHEGGVNATTGDIAKGNPQNFQIKTPTATVKPASEQSEFAVGVCDKECEENAKKEAANATRDERSVVARVVDMKGEVSAINRADKNAKGRPLSIGKPLYNSDYVSSEKDSYALMVFPDGQKVTLKADSEMEIKQYNYQIKDKKDQVLLRLATGGLRALTGSIGKKDHGAYSLDTPVATIGIRGSGGDTDTDGSSLTQSTWQDTTFVKTKDNVEYDVPEGKTLAMDNPNATPEIYNTPPSPPKPSDGPRPDSDKSDPKKVFEEKPPAKGDTSVSVTKGGATMESNSGKGSTSVQEGETGSTNSDNKTTNSGSGDNSSFSSGSFGNSSSFSNGTDDDSPDGC